MYKVIDESNFIVTVNSDEELINYTNEIIADYNNGYTTPEEALENNPTVSTVQEAIEALKEYERRVEKV